MWLKCVARRHQNVHFKIGQICTVGLLSQTWRTISDGSPMGEQGTNSHTLAKLAPAGTAWSTPHTPLSPDQRVFVGWSWLGRESPLCLKASAHWCLVSLFSILSAFVYKKKRLRQSVGQYQKMVLTPHWSERLQFCFVLSVSSSIVSHRSFTAPELHLHGFEGFSAAAIL